PPPRGSVRRELSGFRSSLLLLLPQPPHTGGGRLPCRLLVRAECGADRVVVEVVPVAEDDRSTLFRRQAVCQLRELFDRRELVLTRGLDRQLGRRSLPARGIDDRIRRDRQDPGP